MVAEAVGRWGGLDVLHNSVGIEWRELLMDTTEEEWDRVITVDLNSMLLATQAALRGAGRTAYAAAKAGVLGFVVSVAIQLAPKAIRVNAIAPGTVWTPMVEDLGPEMRERRRRAIPLGVEGTVTLTTR